LWRRGPDLPLAPEAETQSGEAALNVTKLALGAKSR
jgi:hypothetical protein